MFHIEEFAKHSYFHDSRPLQRWDKLAKIKEWHYRALFAKKGEDIPSMEKYGVVQFEKKMIQEIMEEIAEKGFVEYLPLLRKYGMEAVDSVLKFNFFQFRPTRPIVEDIEGKTILIIF